MKTDEGSEMTHKIWTLFVVATVASAACNVESNDDNNTSNVDSGTGTAGTGTGTATDTGTGTTGGDACTELTSVDVNGGVTLAADTCHQVNANLDLSDGTLVIEEGVVLEFAEQVQFTVATGGRLTVSGTQANPVIFRGQQDVSGFWQGVQIQSRGVDNTVDYLTVENAGSDAWLGGAVNAALGAIYMDTGSGQTFTGLVVRNGAGNGILARSDDVELAISSSTITGMDRPMWLHPELVGGIGEGNDFTGNTDDRIFLTFSNNNAVTSAQTWVNPGVPYYQTDRSFVRAPLTLSPGTVVQFAEDAAWRVQDEGRLTAPGTEMAPIVFTGAEALRGYWMGIEIATGGVANDFDWVTVEYAGSVDWYGGGEASGAIYLPDSAELRLTNSTIRESGLYGLLARGGSALPEFSGNTFDSNARVGHLPSELAGSIAADTAFTNNDEQAFRLVWSNNESVTTDQTWAAIAVPWLVTDRMYVDADLVIAPGTTVAFLENASINVRNAGTLSATGTADARIVFTGADETPGFWKGLSFGTGSATNALDYADVLYAGGVPWFGGDNASAAIYVPGTLNISNSTVAHSQTFAIIVDSNNGLLNCGGGNTFMNNMPENNIAGDVIGSDETVWTCN